MVFIKCTRFEISFLLSCHVRVVMCSFMLLLLLSGCATWGDHGVTVSRGEKFRIAILPLKVTAEVDKASDIMTPPTSVVDEGKLIRKQMRDVAVQLSGLVNSKLLESSYIDPVPLESHEIVSSMPATSSFARSTLRRETSFASLRCSCLFRSQTTPRPTNNPYTASMPNP